MVSNVRVGRPRALGVGADSFDLLVTLKVLGLRLDARVAAFRVDRMLGLLLTMSEPGVRVPRAVSKRLAGIMAARARAELVPRSTGAPFVTGTAPVGQMLTTTRGTWRGTRRASRTSGSGATPWGSRARDPGSHRQQYVVEEADVGSGFAWPFPPGARRAPVSSVSAPTSVVPEIMPPVNLSPPTIAGTPQVGQTLAAQGAGTWTGNPVRFRFQWLRCDAAGGACISHPRRDGQDVRADARADAGSTIRVAVPRQRGGETTVVSAPTAVVT